MEIPTATAPRVVIIGAGFGGLEAAKHLGDGPAWVTVIDRTNYHLFQPLLYQVATAALSPADIAAPVRGILGKYENIEVMLAEVQAVDVEARLVRTAEREMQEAERIENGLWRVPEGFDQRLDGSLGCLGAVGMAPHAVDDDEQGGVFGDRNRHAILIVVATT